MKKLIFVFVAFAIGMIGLQFHVNELLKQRLIITEPELVVIPLGQTSSGLISELQKDGIITESFGYKILLKRFHYLTRIRAGTYQVEPGMSFIELMSMVTSGNEKLFSITLVEGRNIYEVAQQLSQHPRLSLESRGDVTPKQIASWIGVDHAEGWLFPDTYHFPAGTSARTVAKIAHDRMKSVLEKQWGENQNAQIKDPYELLILASIIEKETGVASERPLIASVFTNRLEQNMRLQTDPTVIYGIGPDFNGDITRKDLRTPTEYNTYVIKRLPPTPIAMSGKGALSAAANPVSSDKLYFVSRGDGTHYFSASYEEHKQAVQKYQLGK